MIKKKDSLEREQKVRKSCRKKVTNQGERSLINYKKLHIRWTLDKRTSIKHK